MKWFKHDSDASIDSKLQNLLLDYGAAGYGLYWYCIELIAQGVNENNITFELEHDARIIARNLNLSFQECKDMMKYMIELGLFSLNNEKLVCYSLAKRLDQSMTSSPKMRGLISQIKSSHDKVMIKSCKNRIEETREEENRIEEIREEEIKNEKITPKKCIDLYRDLISNEQGSIREQTSFNQLVLLKDDLEKIYLGIENFHKSKMPFTYSLPNFLKDKIYLDYQEIKVYSKNKSNQSSQLTEEDLERFGFNKPSEILSLGVVPWTE